MNENDYRQTVRESAEGNEKSEQRAAAARQNRFDTEIAYETFAVDGAMNMLGLDEQTAELVRLGLASELMYKLNDDK